MQYTYSYLKEQFDNYLQSEILIEDPQNLYDPINYIMNLGGKRIRPVSLLIAYNIFKKDVEKAFPLSLAMEMFHNFTLAHDDVMDDAEMRRGKPAMHMEYGLNSAILSGDAMLIYSYKYIFDHIASGEVRDKISKIFTETAIDICAGQQMDMDFEEQNEVELSAYLLMIKLKTAVLLAACLKCGALLGGANDDDAEHLYLYGLNVGLAFQIQDDILDLYGEQSGFGKKVGGDIIQKKKTYLYLKALELVSQDERDAFIGMYNNDDLAPDDKILKVQATFDSLGVRKEAEKLKKELTENAEDHLASISISPIKLSELKKLGIGLLSRKN